MNAHVFRKYIFTTPERLSEVEKMAPGNWVQVDDPVTIEEAQSAYLALHPGTIEFQMAAENRWFPAAAKKLIGVVGCERNTVLVLVPVC